MHLNTSIAGGGLCTETLRVIGLFGALDDGSIGALCGRLEVVELAAGEQVFAQDDPGQALFIILSGTVRLERRCQQHCYELASYGEGEWFGERAVIDMMPRPCSATTVTPTCLLRLTSADLRALYHHDVKAYALLMMNIARQLSRRLRAHEERLAALTCAVLPDA